MQLTVSPVGGPARAGGEARCVVELRIGDAAGGGGGRAGSGVGGGGQPSSKADVVRLEAWLCVVACERAAGAGSAGAAGAKVAPGGGDTPLLRGESPLWLARAELLGDALASCDNRYSFEVQARLPAALPPSFGGSGVRYAAFWAAVATTRSAAAAAAGRAGAAGAKQKQEVVRRRVELLPSELYCARVAQAAESAPAGATPSIPTLLDPPPQESGAEPAELEVLSREDARALLSRQPTRDADGGAPADGAAGGAPGLAIDALALSDAPSADGGTGKESASLRLRVARSSSGTPRSVVAYSVSTAAGQHVMRVLPHSTGVGGVYVLGDVVAGLLDFRDCDADVVCEEVRISLECEEHFVVHRRRGGVGRFGKSTESGAGSGEETEVRTVLCECNEATADVLQSSFVLGLPSDATPSFATAGASGVRLQWVLRFDCVCVSAQGGEGETASWTLPITVLPPLE